MKVKEIMTTRVVTAAEDTDAEQVRSLLVERRIRAPRQWPDSAWPASSAGPT